MLALRLLDLLYLDGYKSLWDKFHDPYREQWKEQRHWVYAHYKEYMGYMFKAHAFQYMLAMRRAKAIGDYVSLYNIMIDWDGDLDGQLIVDTTSNA